MQQGYLEPGTKLGGGGKVCGKTKPKAELVIDHSSPVRDRIGARKMTRRFAFLERPFANLERRSA